MGNLRVWSLVLLGACGGVATEDPMDPIDPPADIIGRCTSTHGGEQINADMLGPDRPSAVEWLRNGAPVSRWTYDYDSANRLVAQRQDHHGPAGSVPDGIEDSARTVEHSATEAVERWMGLPSQVVSEMATYTLDANDRVISYDGGGSMTLVRGVNGRVESSHAEGVDVDTQQAYTTDIVYTYDASGLLSSRTVTDSRGGGPTTLTFSHEVTPGRLVVRVQTLSPYVTYAYDYDAQDRMTRAAVDEDGDAAEDWVIELAYAADGAVTATSSREGANVGTVTLSAACAYQPQAPGSLNDWGRPRAAWLYVSPAIPNAYQ